MDLITTTDDLAAVCGRMAKHPFVTVDTEFLRETTYYPLLCVAQMASPEEAVVVDALATGLDLSPLFALMATESVTKVFHAARQDIEIVWNMAKTIPHPIVDTQVAAMVLGYGDSISYDQLVVRYRIAIAEHHSGDLGIDNRMGYRLGHVPDDFDVLPGGMKHFDDALVSHQRKKRREIDSRGQSINHHRLGR